MLTFDDKDSLKRKNCYLHDCHNYNDEHEHRGHDQYTHASQNQKSTHKSYFLFLILILLGIILFYFLRPLKN